MLYQVLQGDQAAVEVEVVQTQQVEMLLLQLLEQEEQV